MLTTEVEPIDSAVNPGRSLAPYFVPNEMAGDARKFEPFQHAGDRR